MQPIRTRACTYVYTAHLSQVLRQDREHLFGSHTQHHDLPGGIS
jgi:hypothetical protein